MNDHYSYQLYQARCDEALREAEQERLAQEAQSGQEAFYAFALAQLGRGLMTLGQRLQEQAQPARRKAYR